MNISTVISVLEKIAPPGYQESYDNCGLLVGDENATLTNALISLDCTEEVVNEAIKRNCNLIIAHHPIIFGGIKKLTGQTYVERTILLAIKNNISIYAIHTNLDNVLLGVNNRIADKLGLINRNILRPKSQDLLKLVVYVPIDYTEKVRMALCDAGAGAIGNYDQCSFFVSGIGTFRGNAASKPFIGEKETLHREAENRLEVLFPSPLKNEILKVLSESHPYEEVAYDLQKIENENQMVGSGMIGQLEEALSEADFLRNLKSSMNLTTIKHTRLTGNKIKKVALCGGSGSFLLKDAIKQKADIFISADFKYHDYFDADKKLIIADIGHYESEVFTKDLLHDLLKEKIPMFAPLLSNVDTNPVNYF